MNDRRDAFGGVLILCALIIAAHWEMKEMERREIEVEESFVRSLNAMMDSARQDPEWRKLHYGNEEEEEESVHHPPLTIDELVAQKREEFKGVVTNYKTELNFFTVWAYDNKKPGVLILQWHDVSAWAYSPIYITVKYEPCANGSLPIPIWRLMRVIEDDDCHVDNPIPYAPASEELHVSMHISAQRRSGGFGQMVATWIANAERLFARFNMTVVDVKVD